MKGDSSTIRQGTDLTPGPILRLLRTGLFATVLGLIDFFLFEALGPEGGLNSFAFMKPSFFSLSHLLLHLVFSLAVGLSMVLVFLPIHSRLKKSVRIPPIAGAEVAALAFLSSCFIALRLWKAPQAMTQILALIIAALVLLLFAAHIHSNNIKIVGSNVNKECREIFRFFVPLCLILLSAFLFPEFSDLYYRLIGTPARRAHREPNILLVVLDTVRADRLSCYGNPRGLTPNLDRFSREGLLFRNAFSTAPWTVPSHASMFTGLYTRDHGADWDHTFLGEEFLTLAEFLEGEGYRTSGFCENPFLGFSTGYAQGFDEFAEIWREPFPSRLARRAIGRLGVGRDSHQFAPRTVGLFGCWLRRAVQDERPFFAFINLMAAHLPRYPIDDASTQPVDKRALDRIEPVNLVPERFYLPDYRLDDRDLTLMSDIYDQQIRYLDTQVGRILAVLASVGALDETVVVITSDHGENFGEHGLIEHQFGLYDTLIRVPLIIRYPAKIQPRVVDENVSTISIFRTLVSLLDSASTTLPGGNSGTLPVHPPFETVAVYSEVGNGVGMLRDVLGAEAPDFDYRPFDHELTSVILGQHKYIRSSSGREQLFDLSSDPYELQNRTEVDVEVLRDMRTLLASFQHATGEKDVDRPQPVLDPAAESALRELGYIK